MANALAAATWDPLQYCSSKDLSRLDSRFDFALQDATWLVFWTGVPPELARRWAEEHDLPTLTLAMGPLYSDRNPGSVRYGKNLKAWSRYMKAASGRFAEYACRGGRQAVVLTRPPPSIYSTRKRSNYRDLEEPILKGLVGGRGTVRIEYAHPTVAGGATFQYQIWPLDMSNTWQRFIANLLAKGRIIRDYTSTEDHVALEVVESCGTVVQLQNITKDEQCKAETAPNMAQETKENVRNRAELEQRIALEKKQAKRRKSESERRQALEKRDLKRKRVELEQQRALEKKEAKQKKVILEQQKAQEKRETKRKRLELEQQLALERKEAKQKIRDLVQQKALEKKEAKRKRVELEQQRALEKKEVNQKKVILEQQKALEKRETKRKRLELEQQIALEKKQSTAKAG